MHFCCHLYVDLFLRVWFDLVLSSLQLHLLDALYLDCCSLLSSIWWSQLLCTGWRTRGIFSFLISFFLLSPSLLFPTKRIHLLFKQSPVLQWDTESWNSDNTLRDTAKESRRQRTARHLQVSSFSLLCLSSLSFSFCVSFLQLPHYLDHWSHRLYIWHVGEACAVRRGMSLSVSLGLPRHIIAYSSLAAFLLFVLSLSHSCSLSSWTLELCCISLHVHVKSEDQQESSRSKKNDVSVLFFCLCRFSLTRKQCRSQDRTPFFLYRSTYLRLIRISSIFFSFIFLSLVFLLSLPFSASCFPSSLFFHHAQPSSRCCWTFLFHFRCAGLFLLYGFTGCANYLDFCAASRLFLCMSLSGCVPQFSPVEWVLLR